MGRSVERLSEDDQREPKISSSSLCLALEEAANAEIERFVTEHILVRRELATVERSFAPAIHLPQTVVLRFHKANVVQVDLVLGGWGGSIASSSGSLVGALKSFGFV